MDEVVDEGGEEVDEGGEEGKETFISVRRGPNPLLLVAKLPYMTHYDPFTASSMVHTNA